MGEWTIRCGAMLAAALLAAPAMDARAAGPAAGPAQFGARETVEHIDLSPDGRHVVYVTPGKGRTSLALVANLESGAAPRNVLQTSGDPETPVLGGVYDANSDLYRAVYGDVNSERRPTFHQLDVRGEKKWTFEDWSLTAYLEVLNAYNAQNVEGTTYSFDYTEKETATGLPIFPNLGIRGEL